MSHPRGPLLWYSSGSKYLPTGPLYAADGTTILLNTAYTKGDLLYASATDTPAKLGIGAQNNLLGVNASGLPAWLEPIDPRNQIVIFDDFISVSNLGSLTWTATQTGTSAGATVVTSTTNHPGLLQMLLGTSTDSGSTWRNLSLLAFLAGGGAITFRSSVAWAVLSTALVEYAHMIGLGDTVSTTSVVPTDGIGFIYDRLTYGNFFAVFTVNNGASTITPLDGTSGNPSCAVVAAANNNLRYEVNAAGTQVDFYIEEVLVKSHTTNIPTSAGRECGPNFGGVKTKGSSSSSMNVDYFYLRKVFTTPR